VIPAAPWPGPPSAKVAEMIRSLELTVTRKLDGILHGQHQGITPGHGSEAGESRQYIVGDDVRRIDWNVTARTRELYVREQIADRDLEAWIAVDCSPSMAFGTDQAEKRHIALGATAAVGFLTSRSRNKVGAVIASGPEVKAFAPRAGRDHLRAVMTAIATAPSTDGSGHVNIGALASDVGGRCRRRGFVCIISDFLTPSPQWKASIGALALRHEVLAIEIVDQRELDLPAIGTITLTDPATGRRREVHLTPKIRSDYATAAAAQRELIRTELLATGARHLQLRTDSDWLTAVIRHVRERRRQPGALAAGGVR
jgi:uncharacterized protein (DUF58 family)